jgi:hypothetical protein
MNGIELVTMSELAKIVAHRERLFEDFESTTTK